jgi:2'-5' RNA ligase
VQPIAMADVLRQRHEVEKRDYSYGSTQVEIDPASTAAARLSAARRQIDDAHVGGHGKDVDGNHVTVRYGLLNESLDDLRTFLRGLEPFDAQVTDIELFPATEHSDGMVPVVARITSPALRTIEQQIGLHADFKEKSFPTYKPHATLAYVKPAYADRYADLPVGGNFWVQAITISHPDGGKEIVPFEGLIRKADEAGRFVTPFVDFSHLGDAQLQMIASLNASRLATWGFTAEAEMRGVTRYRLTAVLDGRTSKFCQLIDGKIFEVEDGREKVLEALRVQDPNDLKVVQPWPKQDRASMAMFAEMTPEEFVARGLHIPPYHPHCRTVCILATGAPKKTPSPTPEPGLSDQQATVETFAEMGIEATQDDVDHWNAYVGLSPAELVAKLGGATVHDVLTGKVKSAIAFPDNGDISVRTKGINVDVKYAVGTTLDPYTGTYYLNDAEVIGDVGASARYLKQLMGAMTETGVSAGWSKLAVALKGLPTPYVQLGFLPEAYQWETLRTEALAALKTSPDLKAMMASFAPEDALLVEHLLLADDPLNLQVLTDLKLSYQRKSVVEWLFPHIDTLMFLDLTDPDVLAQVKAYLS